MNTEVSQQNNSSVESPLGAFPAQLPGAQRGLGIPNCHLVRTSRSWKQFLNPKMHRCYSLVFRENCHVLMSWASVIRSTSLTLLTMGVQSGTWSSSFQIIDVGDGWGDGQQAHSTMHLSHMGSPTSGELTRVWTRVACLG